MGQGQIMSQISSINGYSSFRKVFGEGQSNYEENLTYENCSPAKQWAIVMLPILNEARKNNLVEYRNFQDASQFGFYCCPKLRCDELSR